MAGRVPVSLKSCSAGVVLSGRIPFLRGDHQRAVRKNEPDKRGEIFASVEALAKDRCHRSVGYTTVTNDGLPEDPESIAPRAASSWAFELAPERSLFHAYIGKFRSRGFRELQAG